MFVVKWITFALWSNILLTGRSDFKLDLTPLKPVVRVGEDLKLTCSAISCPVNATFTWRTLLDKVHGGKTENEPNVSRLLIRNTTVRHTINVVCKATCERTTLEKTSAIKVYSFPQDPVLPKIKSLRANQTQRLSCTVYNIYPLERLEIEWLLGNQKHWQDSPAYKLYDHKKNYSSVYNYTHSVDKLGKNITCKATLRLENDFEKTRSSTVEYGPGTITVSKNNTSVKLGEHLEITCHADGNPKPTILWWKQEETDPAPLSQNGKLIINNATWSQAGWYQCNATNDVGSLQVRVKVIVLGPPGIPKIQLSHSGDIEEGENITIFCSSDGRPAELTIYKQNTTVGGPSESAALLNMPSIQISDAGIYICEAKNDFGTERSTISITVKVNADPPNIPKIQLSHIGDIEEGENVTIFCSSYGRPAELMIYQQSQNATAGGPSKSAALLNMASIQISDTGTYICEAKNDFGTERSTINITVKAQQNASMPDLPIAIVPAIGSVSLLTAAGLLIRHCRKKARGSFNLELN